MAHELGHIFGLRHFFAPDTETGRGSVLYGSNNDRTIMNYGAKSVLTKADRRDLTSLYHRVWTGQLEQRWLKRIRLVKPGTMRSA